MPTGHAIQPSPLHAVTLPPPGTPAGDAAYQEFAANVRTIMGDVRFLYLPKRTDTTTSTDQSKNGTTITHVTTLAGRLSNLGSGVVEALTGGTDFSNLPDANNLSFGDGTIDQPNSGMALIYPNDTASMAIMSKWKDTVTAAREWLLWINATKKVAIEFYDESASAMISRIYNTAMTASTWQLWSWSYDGSRATTGIRLFRNGAKIDDNNGATTGTYVAMENSAQLARLGSINPTNTLGFAGSRGVHALSGKNLTDPEHLDLYGHVRAYYGL